MSDKVDEFVNNSKQWRDEIEALRAILLSSKLDEDFKWSKPCYTFEENNIAIIQPFKSTLALMFFKGTLLKDPDGVLVANGPNSQSSKRYEFGSVQEINKAKSKIKAHIKEAIEIEKAVVKVELKKKNEPTPDELTAMFKSKPKFKKAFEGLTPGRQRAYILHFSSAKQSATRISRIEKCMPRILEGKGINDI
ncbi:MAG: hypothetical protein EOP07_14545 [Proteobacteria bacterium]|nr:MAG: hypothetical protein EOP07_14545 [Pseudomonadota bacterium]